MPFRTVFDPEAIEMLSTLLDTHCAKFGTVTKEGREAAAYVILSLYEQGVTDPVELARRVEETLKSGGS